MRANLPNPIGSGRSSALPRSLDGYERRTQQYVVKSMPSRKPSKAAPRHGVMRQRHHTTALERRLHGTTPGCPVRSCLSGAVEKIKKGENTRKTQDDANGDAPAGLLSGTIHDFLNKKPLHRQRLVDRRPSIVNEI
jgi:hypothetical protein